MKHRRFKVLAGTQKRAHLNRLKEVLSYRKSLHVDKVIRLYNKTEYPICPRCGISLEREYVNYCDRCGQRLGWHRLSSARVCFPIENHKVEDEAVNKMDLGKRIRECRVSKGYTQKLLAEKADIGLMYLGEIERGIKMPSLNCFMKLIQCLDISADYILRDELPSGAAFVCDEITKKLLELTPQQRKTAVDILDAYIKNLY